MTTKTQSRSTSAQLNGQIQEYIQTLAEATDQVRLSTTMTDYLESCTRFHHYSPRNIWLIRFQKPEATRVAGFLRWKSLGRSVRKGERGIPILAPIFQKAEEDDGENPKLVSFRVVYVFDISQTEGEPLPEPPEWKSPQRSCITGRTDFSTFRINSAGRLVNRCDKACWLTLRGCSQRIASC
ncbi:MAG: hypothetical protein H8D34_28075 [Chloroflexi bacterium]|nr:hypothetical protein [Chloroflexota bacterium]